MGLGMRGSRVAGCICSQSSKTTAELSLAVHWYEANHAFANPSGSRYDEEDARVSWSRTLVFLRKHLG